MFVRFRVPSSSSSIRRSERLALVPSILQERAASLFIYGEINKCGLGSCPPSPDSSDKVASAFESATARSMSKAMVGGRALGENAKILEER